jgi:uroporphyrinogen-III synthase
MIPAIVIRPAPGDAATVAGLEALGVTAHGFPLFRVRPVAWEPPEPAEVDALLIGSANVPRQAGNDLALFRGKPAYVVGEATATACRGAGLTVAAVAQGGLQEVLGRLAPEHTRLLRLAGEERVALVAPEGTTMTERVVYAAEPVAMPGELAGLLRRPAVVLLHSAAAARHFAAECARLAVPRAPLRLATIGPRVAAEAGNGWATVAAAERPAEHALLALARELCQEPPA